MMDNALLARHLPVITNRLRFFPQSISSPPVITPRIDFGERLVALAHTPRENLSTDDSSSIDSALTDIAASVTASVTPPADLGSDSGGEEELHAVNKKIAKPRGQAGHPGSGGYSLDVVLRKWGSSLIGDVNVSD
jgi:hypothetical protein